MYPQCDCAAAVIVSNFDFGVAPTEDELSREQRSRGERIEGKQKGETLVNTTSLHYEVTVEFATHSHWHCPLWWW